MSRETLLDDAIAKAKEAEDWQLVEWLCMARGGESAARWYTAKLGEARLDMSKLMTENAKLRELCADMWHVMWACAEQRCKHRENECYVVNGNNGALPSHDECWYKRRMRELGVDE